MRHFIGICLALAVVAAFPGDTQAQQIGVVASVQPDMRGRPPGSSASVKSTGSRVVADETITTSGSGRGQIMFRDKTTLTISPNSEIVLDEFIFDANANGKSGLSLTRGALRFIGGKNSRDQDATIRTPTAIIGVRGSSALVTYQGNQTRAILIAGDRLCLTAAGGGEGSCTNRQGGIMTEQGYAGQVSQADLAQIIRQIDGPPSATARFQGDQNGNAGAQSTTDTGLSGIASAIDPRSDPASSRGALRDYSVFDDDIRDDAIAGITSSQETPGFFEPEVFDDLSQPDAIITEDPIVQLDAPIISDPVMDDPIVSDPVIADPIVDDPIIDDPIIDDPIIDDPIIDDPIDEPGDDPIHRDPGDGGIIIEIEPL